jgi:hypothetical protein
VALEKVSAKRARADPKVARAATAGRDAVRIKAVAAANSRAPIAATVPNASSKATVRSVSPISVPPAHRKAAGSSRARSARMEQAPQRSIW